MPQPMRIWIVQAGEANEGLEIAYAGAQGMVFADTADGYGQAFAAFQKLAVDRCAGVQYTFGDFGTDARADITATGYQRSCNDDDCGCAYAVDIVKLTAFEVIGG
jgi:hypothetical protein